MCNGLIVASKLYFAFYPVFFYLLDLANVPPDYEFESLYDDNSFDVEHNDDFIIDASFDTDETEPQIELEIAKYICDANLDKSKTNQLLTLLNHVHDQCASPPSSSSTLWGKLNIKFQYIKIQYCTNCMSELTQPTCPCKPINKLIPSELIIFPIVQEIARVVNNNYDLIQKYKLEKHDNEDDIVSGMLHCFNFY
jgi:hypothetical protein